MDENKARRRHFEDEIPAEARAHARAAREELRESMKALLPPRFVEHRRKARKEMLLAWRSLIDSAIQRMDQTTDEETV